MQNTRAGAIIWLGLGLAGINGHAPAAATHTAAVSRAGGAERETAAQGAPGTVSTSTAGIGISVKGPVVSVDTAVVPTFLVASGTLDFSSISSNACQVMTFAFPGAAPGDSVIGGWPADMSTGIVPRVLVPATDTVQIQLCNVSKGSVDPPSRTYGATIVRSF